MKKRKPCCAVAVVAWVSFAALASPYEGVLPVLRQVDVSRTEGAVSCGSFGRAKFSRGTVAGAPEAVADQAYRIDLSPKGVRVVSGGEAGERYARATLDQLVKLAEDGCVPAAVVTDWPALKWRGFMNDCGRNFLRMEGVKAILDVMAKMKMNLFHWHIADYHGWRLESKKYPKLTAPETMMRQIGRFYSQDDFREIIAYAKARGITVMPELDVPGHTLALRKGLGISEMRAPGTDEKVEDLFVELCSLVPKDVMPFVHLGTDEVRVDPEYVPEGWCSKWAEALVRCGRDVVVWAPGEKLSASGRIIDMAWHDDQVTNSANAYFDAARMYFASTGPELILNQALFVKPCRWAVDPARALGAIACAWHDDNVGDDDTRLFADSTIVPGILGFADNYWAGDRTDLPQYLTRLPPPGTAPFAEAVRLERRIVAMRDRVLADFPYAIPYLAQTDQRWRVAKSDGTLLEANLPGALVDVATFLTNVTGEVVAETWVKSPKTQEVGAWICFTKTGSAYTRLGVQPLPKEGQWNRQGAFIELNGARIAPPKWQHPGLTTDGKRDPDGKSYKGAVWSNSLCETPLADEWPYIREPTRVTLKAGWNHVKLVMPMPKKCARGQWRGIFHLLEGSSAHPREVPGLEYSARPMEND